MATPEILSLLCAGSTRYHPSGGQGRPLLSRLEVAGLLAGLEQAALDLALAKYCGDLDAERALVARVRVFAAGLAVEQGWDIVRGRPTVTTMGKLAVYEVVRPNVCRRCGGNGFLKGDRRVVRCQCCDGSGSKALSQMAIAESCGIPETTWRRSWAGRYELVYRHVAALDSAVCRRLRENGW